MQPTLKDWLARKPRQKAKKGLKRSGKPLKRSRMRSVSKGRAKQLREYSVKRRAFLKAHPWCQIWLRRHYMTEEHANAYNGWFAIMANLVRCPRSCDVHHSKGRTGKNYLDETTWVAASREEHEWAHRHPSQARALGLLV
jgi:hypothetical protein